MSEKRRDFMSPSEAPESFNALSFKKVSYLNKICHILVIILKGRAAENYPMEEIKVLFMLMAYFTAGLSFYRQDSLQVYLKWLRVEL